MAPDGSFGDAVDAYTAAQNISRSDERPQATQRQLPGRGKDEQGRAIKPRTFPTKREADTYDLTEAVQAAR